MDAITAALVNLGLGGVMTAALIWFLHHVVTVTLPALTKAFREEMSAEREQRTKEHRRLLNRIERNAERLQRNHELLLDRIDFGFKALTNEITDRRGGQHPAPQSPVSPHPGAGSDGPK